MVKERKYLTQKEQRYWRSTWEKTGKKRGQTLYDWLREFLNMD